MITAFIPGEPPRVTAQMKKTICRGGKPLHVDSPELKEAKKFFFEKLMPFRPSMPLSGPVCIRIKWVFPHRSDAPKRWLMTEVSKDTAPDLDNLEKALLDSIQKLGFYGNDGQIADKHTRKFWGPHTGIFIEMEEIKL